MTTRRATRSRQIGRVTAAITTVGLVGCLAVPGAAASADATVVRSGPTAATGAIPEYDAGATYVRLLVFWHNHPTTFMPNTPAFR